MSKHQLPPGWIEQLFTWLCRSDELEVMLGDLYELYQERLEKRGKIRADFYFFLEVLDLCRPFIVRNPFESSFTVMIRNYLKITLRNVYRQKVYSVLNIAGLSIGLVCFMLIALYINDELSYDRFHSKSERIYRVLENFESEGIGEHSASLPFPTGPALKNDFSGQVAHAVRLFNFQSPTLALSNKAADKAFNESHLFFADSNFLDVFDYQMLAGDRKTALDQPNAILLSASMARKYFGDEDPMGKVLEFQGRQNLQVTGILENSPSNAHFRYDFIVSFSSLKQWYGNGKLPGSWYWNPCWTYILLHENTIPDDLIAQFPDFVNKYFPDFVREDIELELQPLTDIHLHSRLDYEITANNDIKNIYTFGVIAIFVLFIATINFINLSTARAGKRAKEVGVRKSLGSRKAQLVTQFVFESVFMTCIAVFLAFGLVIAVLPFFNVLVGKEISLQQLLQPYFLIGAVLLTFTVGILAGFYPAF
ncbi:MAG: ABC transporter permease, partial [Bacteroidota bacterium]